MRECVLFQVFLRESSLPCVCSLYLSRIAPACLCVGGCGYVCAQHVCVCVHVHALFAIDPGALAHTLILYVLRSGLSTHTTRSYHLPSPKHLIWCVAAFPPWVGAFLSCRGGARRC